MARLHGKVAVITGGAGGIGRAAGALFLHEGASVLLVDRPGSGVAAAAREIGDRSAGRGAAIAGFEADVTEARNVDAYVRDAEDRFGGVDIALLNAGIEGLYMPIEQYPPETFAQVMAVNVGAVWLGLRAAVAPMRRRGGGSVVITSSIQGASALPYTSAYTTSKHAVIGMMKGAALELAKDRIRVNCVIPGMTDTPMMDRIHEASGAAEAMAASVRATIPMRRYARAGEIAQLMLFLASDESSYCTGSTYSADGGILASWTATPG
jgi:NAD(P)-dependent dehydrogenase (short-subunit alcohol dehydrogenase family)